jgi:hypothetical protein
MLVAFRDEARTMQALLTRSGGAFSDNLCAGGKPSERFFALLKNISQLSHGEQIILRIALDLWNEDGDVRLSELFCLDARNQALVLSLLSAMSAGPRAIEKWIVSGRAG